MSPSFVRGPRRYPAANEGDAIRSVCLWPIAARTNGSKFAERWMRKVGGTNGGASNSLMQIATGKKASKIAKRWVAPIVVNASKPGAKGGWHRLWCQWCKRWVAPIVIRCQQFVDADRCRKESQQNRQKVGGTDCGKCQQTWCKRWVAPIVVPVAE